MRLVFDIESDGLLDSISTVWCVVTKDIDTGQIRRFRPHEISSALDHMSRASFLCGHNAYGFDLPALCKVHRWNPHPRTITRDTLILAKLNHADLQAEDARSKSKAVQALIGKQSLHAWGVRLKFHKGDYGKEEGAWDAFSEEMLEYCVQDVELTHRLFKHLESEGIAEEAADLEHRFAAITEQMSLRGFTFDTEKAKRLYNEIKDAQTRIEAELQADIPATIEEMKTPAYWRVTWPDGSTQDFDTKGAADTERKARKVRPKDFRVEPGPNKVKNHPFNPGSRQQIRKLLFEKYNWKAPELTDSGFVAVLHARDWQLVKEIPNTKALKPWLKKNWNTPPPTDREIAEFAHLYGTINEETLSECQAPEAEKLTRYLMMGKRLGQIGDGDNGWLRLVVPETGRIHHRMDTIGCATMRCAHRTPNIGQTPRVEVGTDTEGNKIVLKGEEGGWGWECRDCFVAAEGYDLVGADLSGIEARMLAHFLYPFDNGQFIEDLLNGDIHQKNAEAMSEVFRFEILRQDTKSPFYATLYGGGLVKLGKTLCRDNKNAKEHHPTIVCKLRHEGLDEAEAIQKAYAAIGTRVKEGLERGIKGLGPLQEAVRSAAKRGYLSPFDGRRIPVRSPHSSLNSLLQGTATIVMKRWITTTFEEVKRRQWDCHLLAVVHDESQTECRPRLTQEYSDLTLRKIKEAGEYYRLKCPLDGEVKVGTTWATTH